MENLVIDTLNDSITFYSMYLLLSLEHNAIFALDIYKFYGKGSGYLEVENLFNFKQMIMSLKLELKILTKKNTIYLKQQ
tara:strand:+ start:2381 stop:2617 length:237 start_codon:yes stop_codon:yes gene_type:complete